ncbi:MAG TPA: zinc ribbon domain-containing protein [Gemmatimonadales bacterium]|nr:zinc ribbon domain-containing protein [Gemmatimonadales bacterium]
MNRQCPQCGTSLAASVLRCGCGYVFPEARDVLSDPDHPRCAACGKAMELMALTCPSCGATGYPALRARRGKKTLGAPPDGFDGVA